MKKTLPIIAAIIVVGVLAFYGGMKFGGVQNLQGNSLQGNQRNFAGMNFQGQAGAAGTGAGANANFARRGGQGGNAASGQILSVDDKSITVSIPTGGSKIIFFSASTKISKSVDAAVSDLTAGVNVMANGTTNPDGSVTATTIQIRPEPPRNPAGTQQTQAAPQTQTVPQNQ
jgi:hypothetical protein